MQSFNTGNADADVRSLNHRNVIGTVANCQRDDITLCINELEFELNYEIVHDEFYQLTSFDLEHSRTSIMQSAFWIGETRQQITALQLTHNS